MNGGRRMFDIAGQLFPNIMTIVVQLCATGVIYVFYKKYLHQSVLNLMDKKAILFQEEYRNIEAMREEQVQLKELLEFEKRNQSEQLEFQRKKMLEDIDSLRNQLLFEAKSESESLRIQSSISIEQERNEMLQNVEKHIISVSAMMVEKVLEGYTFNENQIMTSLEKELEKHHARS